MINIEYGHILIKEIEEKCALSDEQLRSIDLVNRYCNNLKKERKEFVLCVFIDDYNVDDNKIISNKKESSKYVYKLFKKEGTPPDFIFFESDTVELARKYTEYILPSKDAKKYHDFIKPKGEDRLEFSYALYNYSLSRDNRELGGFIPKNNANKAEIDDLLRTKVRKLLKGNKTLGVNDSSIKDRIFKEENILVNKIWFNEKKQLKFDLEPIKFNANVLLKDKAKYFCPLLTSCWYLFRLGKTALNDKEQKLIELARQDNNSKINFIGKRLVTILPLRYINNESVVCNLLKIKRSNQDLLKQGRIEYIFY